LEKRSSDKLREKTISNRSVIGDKAVTVEGEDLHEIMNETK